MVTPSPEQTNEVDLQRRNFMVQAVTAAAAVYLPSSALLGCQTAPAITASAGADVMDEALQMMSGLAPLTNHGPMAAEALVALGRAERVIPWVENYKKRFVSSYPNLRSPITRETWRAALGDGSRVADWTAFFNRQLKEATWTQVVGDWSTTLAPGLAAAAAHGLIRTGHAVRSLAVKETDLRRRELAEGLGYWAAYYQALPEAPEAKPEKIKPALAINQIPLLPVERRGGGSIMIGLTRLNDFPPFAPTADLVEIPDDADKFLSELTEPFATAYVRNVNPRNVITLVHTITGLTALRPLLPYLTAATRRVALRYAWQVAAALYSISAVSTSKALSEVKGITRAGLIDRAAAAQDEHAIKFTEACLREHELNPQPVYLHAAHDAIQRLEHAGMIE